MSVVDGSFGHPLRLEEKAAGPLAGGIVQHGYQCGMIWGSALAAGAQAYRHHGSGMRAETMAIGASQRIVQSFRACNGETNCLEITGIGTSSSTRQMLKFFLIKGGVLGCLRMAARYAPVARREIHGSLSTEPIDAPSGPVSCAAVLARRMGATDMHAVMAAGLAGGIGLSGGACGALGAAIWIRGMATLKERGTLAFKDPGALAIVERFITSSDYEFECATIVGRVFQSVGDHARHLREGGCARILEVLAAA